MIMMVSRRLTGGSLGLTRPGGVAWVTSTRAGDRPIMVTVTSDLESQSGSQPASISFVDSDACIGLPSDLPGDQ